MLSNAEWPEWVNFIIGERAEAEWTNKSRFLEFLVVETRQLKVLFKQINTDLEYVQQFQNKLQKIWPVQSSPYFKMLDFYTFMHKEGN